MRGLYIWCSSTDLPIEGLIWQRRRTGKGRKGRPRVRGGESLDTRGYSRKRTGRLVGVAGGEPGPSEGQHGSVGRAARPDIVEELGRELGLGPTDEELLSAEDYLLEHGYIAPTGLGVTRNVYTVTRAGLDWLEADLTAPRGKSQQGPSEEAQRERDQAWCSWAFRGDTAACRGGREHYCPSGRAGPTSARA